MTADEAERAIAAEQDAPSIADDDEPPTLPAAQPNVRATVNADGNIDLEYDDGITVFQIFGIAALLTRLANSMLDAAAVGRAQKDATRAALLAPQDHLPKRRN